MRKRRAFTLVELVSAVAALAVMIALGGVVFQHAVEGYRKTKANAEILQKYITITQQLRDDFSGLVVDMPVKMSWFDNETTTVNPDTDEPRLLEETRADSIVFFATGDFQTTQIQDSSKVIRSNVAMIQYCIATKGSGQNEGPENPLRKALLRRQMVLTSSEDFESDANVPDASSLEDVTKDDELEYEAIYGSLAGLRADMTETADDVNSLDDRLAFEPNSYPGQMSNLLAQGVYDFKIKIIGSDSWAGSDYQWLDKDSPYSGSGGINFPQIAFPGGTEARPTAIKFTFRVCDSKGVVEEYDYVEEELKPGRLFTYIIPIKENLVGSVQ